MHPPIEESIAQSPRPRVTEYFSQGFNIVFKSPLLFILAIILLIGSSFLLSEIPGGGLVHSLFLQPLLMLGFYIAADRINYQENIEVGTFFEGFKGRIGQVVLANLLMVLILIVPIAIAFVGLFSMIGMDMLLTLLQSDPEDIASMDLNPSFSIVGLLVFLFFMLITLYLALTYTFTFLMIWFKGLDAWPALEASRKLVNKHIGHFIVFFLFAILVNMAGALLLGVGLLLTIPASYAAIYVAFDDLVSARPKGEDEEQLFQHLIS